MSLVLPGQQNISMEDIQRQEAMRRALIQQTIIDTGSRIFANFAANYYLSLPIGAKVDIDRLRQLAGVSKDFAMFYAEAHGMVNLQVQQNEQGTTE